jgi:hypothetical protein
MLNRWYTQLPFDFKGLKVKWFRYERWRRLGGLKERYRSGEEGE